MLEAQLAHLQRVIAEEHAEDPTEEPIADASADTRPADFDVAIRRSVAEYDWPAQDKQYTIAYGVLDATLLDDLLIHKQLEHLSTTMFGVVSESPLETAISQSLMEKHPVSFKAIAQRTKDDWHQWKWGYAITASCLPEAKTLEALGAVQWNGANYETTATPLGKRLYRVIMIEKYPSVYTSADKEIVLLKQREIALGESV